MSSKPLKAGIGVRYLAPIVICYVGLVVLLAAPAGFSWNTGLQHASVAGLLGLAVLALQELPTRALKEMAVHWRIRDRLPGTRAFTRHAPGDSRIDLNQLRGLLDPMPATPREENAVWYRWLKQTEDAVEVAETHRRYLILRDAAVVCLLLAIATIALLVLPGWQTGNTALLFALCMASYLVLALSAHSVSIRLVTTVIATKLARSTTNHAQPAHTNDRQGKQPANGKRGRSR